MIGLCGAHRTGKTTLGREYSIVEGISFVQTSATETYKRLGKNPRSMVSFKDRLEIQSEILKDANDLWETEFGERFISDRTPIDMIAYTLADINNSTNLSAEELRLADEYIQSCFESINRHFNCLVLLQPGIPIIEEEGKASCNPLFMNHLNSIMMGLLMSDSNRAYGCFIPKSTLDLTERIKAVQISQARAFNRIDEILINKAKGLNKIEVFRSDSIH